MQELTGLTIDFENVVVTEVQDDWYAVEVILQDGRRFAIFSSAAEAGRAARQYWEDLAREDPGEFASAVGIESVVAWAFHEWGGPGQHQVMRLEDWLDLWLNTPIEHWSIDDTELDAHIEPDSAVAEEIGFDGDAVAYQTR